MVRSTFKNIHYYQFSRIRAARKEAAVAHAGQFRKEQLNGQRLPYIIHTDGTAEFMLAAGASEDAVCAGHLHDTLEDTLMTAEEILKKFGPRVLFLVIEMTEPAGKSWLVRKKFKIRKLKHGCMDVKLLGAADHCDNSWSILEALLEEGCKSAEDFKTAKVWSQFKQGYDKQKWYHQQSCRAIFANVALEDLHPLFGKYMRLVERIFGERVITDLAIRRKVRRRKRNYNSNFKPNIKRPG